jgi:hypothetical protein
MKSLPRYLQQNKSQLSHLQQQVVTLNQLTHKLRQCLPDELATFCRVARHDVQHDVLVISISEHIFLTQLRFLRPHLLQQLRRITPFCQLKEIEVVYTPEAPGPNQPTVKAIHLSVEAKEACLNAAAMCQHPALQQALQRLAQLDDPKTPAID